MRRHLPGVTSVSISEQRQTAQLTFTPGSGPGFSAAAFRTAAKQAAVDVVRFEAEVCGKVEDRGGERSLNAGADRFRLARGESLPLDQLVCVVGGLDDGTTPPTLTVRSVDQDER